MLPITTARPGSMALAVLVLVPLALTSDPAAAQWRNLSRESPEEDVKQFMQQINATRVTIREGELLGDTIRISARAAGWISVREMANDTPLSFREEEGYMAPVPHVVMTYVPREGNWGDTDLKIVAAPRDPDHEVALFTRRPDSNHFGVGEARPGTRTQMWGEKQSLTLRVERKRHTHGEAPTHIFVGTQEPVDEDDPPVWVDLLIIELEDE